MPEKKKQHFIPVFYLKNFSINSAGERLGIFNISSSKFIASGKLRNQAYKNYFYGYDSTIEDSLSKLEYSAAKVINNLIINSSNSIIKDFADYSFLLEFMLFLRERTICMTNQLNESAEKFLKLVISKDLKLSQNIDLDSFQLIQSTQFALNRAATSLPFVADLSCKIFINRTKTPFITSDHPVVLYNQFLETQIKFGSNTGLACKGIEIFLPISSSYLIVFFDSQVYRIGGRRNLYVSIADTSDVRSLNLLQCLNADKNLYFNEDISECEVRDLVDESVKYKMRSRANVDEHSLERKNNKSRYLLHIYSSDIRCNFSLSCIHLLKKARRYKLKNSIAPVRDENICQLYEEFLDLVDEGEYQDYEFYKFLNKLVCIP